MMNFVVFVLDVDPREFHRSVVQGAERGSGVSVWGQDVASKGSWPQGLFFHLAHWEILRIERLIQRISKF